MAEFPTPGAGDVWGNQLVTALLERFGALEAQIAALGGSLPTTTITTTATTNSVTVNWTEVVGATGYLVTRSGVDGSGNPAAPVTKASTDRTHTFSSLAAGTYTISVQPQPNGRVATTTATTTTPPVGGQITLTVSNVTANSFRVDWAGIPVGTTGILNGRDAPGAPVEQPWSTVDPPESTGRDFLWLVPEKKYTVTVTAQPSGLTASVQVELPGYSPTPDPTPDPGTDNKYGFMVFLSNGNAGIDKDIQGIVDAGGTWARLGMYDSGSFNGSGVFQPNTTVWNQFEYACTRSKAAGLKVFWDAADTLRISNSLTNAQWITWQSSMWQYMSERLGDWVDAWQVFNEHDGRDIRTFAARDYVNDPTQLNFFRDALQGARNAIRAGGSTAPVGTTVFGYPINEDRIQRWFRFHDVVSAQMEYIGIHAYPEFNGAIFTSFMNRVYDRYRKPIAVLEFGVPDSGGYGTAPEYQRVGDGIVIQNDALLAVKDRLLAATLFSLRNRVLGGTGEGGFGILDHDWRRKAYWQKVVTSIHKWD
jgi:hypothetical protein